MSSFSFYVLNMSLEPIFMKCQKLKGVIAKTSLAQNIAFSRSLNTYGKINGCFQKALTYMIKKCP